MNETNLKQTHIIPLGDRKKEIYTPIFWVKAILLNLK